MVSSTTVICPDSTSNYCIISTKRFLYGNIMNTVVFAILLTALVAATSRVAAEKDTKSDFNVLSTIQKQGNLPPIGSVVRYEDSAIIPYGWQLCNGSKITQGPLKGQSTPNMIVWSEGVAGFLMTTYKGGSIGSLAACQAWCLEEQPKCRSISYLLTSNDAIGCQLHSRVRPPGEALWSVSNNDWHYYELTRYIMRII